MISACSRSTRSGTPPWTTTEMTSLRFSTFVITGFSASSGKVMIRSTSLFTSCRTRSTSSPVATSAVTTPAPSAAVDLISLIPSTPVKFSSILRRIPSSTSPGPAPG